MASEQTSQSMTSIYRDLQETTSSWEIYKEIRDQLSQHPTGHSEFFHSVRIALLDSVVLGISRILDKDKRTMSISNLLETEPKLYKAPLADKIRQFLAEQETTLTKIKARRDQHIAHQDGTKDDPSEPLTLAEIDEIVPSLVAAFKQIGSLLCDTDYDFERTQSSRRQDTTKVMQALQRDWDNNSPLNRPQNRPFPVP